MSVCHHFDMSSEMDLKRDVHGSEMKVKSQILLIPNNDTTKLASFDNFSS